MTLGRRAKRSIRLMLLGIGRRSGPRTRQRLGSFHSYIDLGAWLQTFGVERPRDYASRHELFQQALSRVSTPRPLYLEFGVYRGDSMRWWSENLTQSSAQLVGFDSFEGLPADWNANRGKGAFAVEGVPKIDDPRVSFEVGWFEKTVPNYELPVHDQLIVNIDSDLYSSAALVLERLATYLVPGTLIYFDEFNDRDHEFRAFREFLSRFDQHVRPLGSSNGGTNWLFEVVHLDGISHATTA